MVDPAQPAPPLDPRTPAGVAHLARLARLSLTRAESDALGDHLGKILDWVAALDAVDTDGVSSSLHDAPCDATRADQPAESLPQERALANAPSKDGVGFVVPAVLQAE